MTVAPSNLDGQLSRVSSEFDVDSPDSGSPNIHTRLLLFLFGSILSSEDIRVCLQLQAT
jgi:hypothetical protein